MSFAGPCLFQGIQGYFTLTRSSGSTIGSLSALLSCAIPLQEGIELTSADVNLNMHSQAQSDDKAKKRKPMLQRQTTDEFMASDTALDIEEDRPEALSNAATSQQSPEERRKQFKLVKGWSDVALQDDK